MYYYSLDYGGPSEKMDEEPFNLERGTGLRYPGQWLESLLNEEDYEDEEGYEDDGDYYE